MCLGFKLIHNSIEFPVYSAIALFTHIYKLSRRNSKTRTLIDEINNIYKLMIILFNCLIQSKLEPTPHHMRVHMCPLKCSLIMMRHSRNSIAHILLTPTYTCGRSRVWHLRQFPDSRTLSAVTEPSYIKCIYMTMRAVRKQVSSIVLVYFRLSVSGIHISIMQIVYIYLYCKLYDHI